MTVAHVLMRSAQLWGDRPALIDTARGCSISFSDLANAILVVGTKLRRHGLAAGDRVALLGDATPDYLCADYGIMAAGMVRVPLDPALSADELANQIVDSGARVLLTDDDRTDLTTLRNDLTTLRTEYGTRITAMVGTITMVTPIVTPIVTGTVTPIMTMNTTLTATTITTREFVTDPV